MTETVQMDVPKEALVESVTATIVLLKDTSDKRQEGTICCVNGVGG